MARTLAWLSLLCCVQGCAIAVPVGSDCGDDPICEQQRAAAAARAGGVNGAPPVSQRPPMRMGSIQRVDVLFVVGDTPAMQSVQNALASSVPRLVEGLASGDGDGGGAPNFRAVTDVHFGVISARMAGAGVGDGSCGGSADGKLTSVGCLPPSAPFARMQGPATAGGTAADIACMVRVGSAGCEPSQPFEAMLKALWPTDGGDFRVGTLTFLDGSRIGVPANAGFLRADSLIVVIVVSDTDDCSLRGPMPIAEGEQNAWLHACTAAPDPRFDLTRYADGLRALRAGADDLVMFFAITGVPAAAVNATALAAWSLEQEDQRDAFYDRLQLTLQSDLSDDRGTATTSDDLPYPVCSTPSGDVYPAGRLLELARSFGPNGLIQSLCESDLDLAMRVILRSIGRRLGPARI